MVKTTHRLVAMMLVTLAFLLASCQGLGNEPRIVATVSPAIRQEAISAANQAAERMAAGSNVWAYGCANCHGPFGEGAADGAPLPDLTALSQERILEIIASGVDDEMPAFQDELDFDELQSVTAYARMLSAARARATAEAVTEKPVETTPGIVFGRVANGTGGGALPDNLTVTLHVYISETDVRTWTTTTDAGGRYQFDDVPMNEAYFYAVTTSYNDALFVSEPLPGVAGGSELELPLTIYESGAEPEDIRIVAIDMQIVVRNDTMQVAQLVTFENTSDRVYQTTGAAGTVSVGLGVPANARFEDHSNEGYVVSDDRTRILDPRPLLPGETRPMFLLYELPYNRSATFEQALDYELTGRVVVQLMTPGLAVDGEGLVMDLVESRGSGLYTGEFDQPAGSLLRFDVRGVAAGAAQTTAWSPSLSISYTLIGVGIGTLLTATLLGIRDFRASRNRRLSLASHDLLQQLVALDREREAGRIAQDEYERRRAELKAQLGALMKAQKMQTQ
ncbi:MAG: c-type cytochrome [Chloroflexota bacterium]